eukprot:gene12538-13722_t
MVMVLEQLQRVILMEVRLGFVLSFGDQHFWGEMVYRAGLGPKPCLIHTVTLDTVISSFEQLISENVLQTAHAMSECMHRR